MTLKENKEEMVQMKEADVPSEKTNTGVQLEWSIVYWSIMKELSLMKDKKKREQKLNELKQTRFKQWPHLEMFGNGVMKEDGQSATESAYKSGADIKEAFHGSEKGVTGKPSPKTDILFGKDRVSVKMRGPIQLSSARGNLTSQLFDIISNELKKDKNFKGKLNEKLLKNIINTIGSMPSNMIDPKNLDKAKVRKPNIVKNMLKGGKLLNQYNWQKWSSENAKKITQETIDFLKKNETFNYKLTEELLTGKRQFGRDNNEEAIATHILTPDIYKEISSTYIKHVMNSTRIDINSKSNAGISTAVVRFSVKNAVSKASKELNEELLKEGLFDYIKNAAQIIARWFEKFKNILKEWYVENIDKISDKILDDLDIEGAILQDETIKENKEEMVQNVIDLGVVRKGELNESTLVQLGGAIEMILGRMFGTNNIPVSIRGTKQEINSFARVLDKEKKYLSVYEKYGLNEPQKIKTKYELETAIKNFERTTGLKYPLR